MLVAAEVGWGWLAAFGEGHHAALVAASLLLGLVGCVLRAGAFVHFAVAFAGNEQARDRRVRRAAGMLMRAYAVLFLGAACNLFLSSALSHRLQEAAYIVLPVLSYVPLVVAAALVAKAFAPRDPGGPGQDATSRDRLLGRAGAYVALGAALILACWFLRGWPRLGLGDWGQISLVARFFGDVLLVLAPAAAAIGFLRFLGAAKAYPFARLLLRVTWLIVAASVLFLAGALAVVHLAASERVRILGGWTWSGGFVWLYGGFPWWYGLVWSICLALAALLAALGFAASRRALARRG